MDSNKYIPRLLYTFIVLFIKSECRSSISPKYKQLCPLMKYLGHDIVSMLPLSQSKYITKEYFCSNITMYFKKVTNAQWFMLLLFFSWFIVFGEYLIHNWHCFNLLCFVLFMWLLCKFPFISNPFYLYIALFIFAYIALSQLWTFCFIFLWKINHPSIHL